MDAFNLGEGTAARPVPGLAGLRSFPANENRPTLERPIDVGGSPTFWAVKRSIDVVLSLLALPALFAIAAVLMIVNPIFNRGPLFYAQSRIGLYGKPFTIIKFRTMIPERGSRAVFAKEDDRITAFAWFLRKFRIDELPQILNVLRGQMSLIGPRPEMIEIVERFSETLPGFSLRHSVRPGISGLSQVMIGYTDCELSYSQKLDYDLRYIREAGWNMESHLFFRTIWVVLTGFGAR